jgi:acetolactate synthase-1/2/3 large subunit
LIEAASAGTPMLHLTGQIDSGYLDQGWGFIHEAKDQPGWLAASSKAFYRIDRPEHAAAIIARALQDALTAPTGPVSVEIPIDIQKATCSSIAAQKAQTPNRIPGQVDIQALVELVSSARRPLLWLGGGAVGASGQASRLADLGFGIVTSVQGRGTLDERHPRSLGSFTATNATEALYRQSDLMIVAGSHLRSNETRTYALSLPERLVRIDVDPAARERSYRADLFIQEDCQAVLNQLADALDDACPIDPDWTEAIAETKRANQAKLRRDMGAYAGMLDAIDATLPPDALWVRDITLSNSIWGNRAPLIDRPGRLAHAVGGGIGQGLAHAIGAGRATDQPVLALIGDGGFMLNPGELATAVDCGVDLTILLMNDQGYGVIRNIQDAAYDGRRAYSDLRTPGFADLARAFGCTYGHIDDIDTVQDALSDRFTEGGVGILEIDMTAIGSFGITFAGPQVGKR